MPSAAEIYNMLAGLQAATARSQGTQAAAAANQQIGQDMAAAEYAKKMEEEQKSGFTKMLPTIAGIAGSFIPGVGIIAGPALASATAAATGQDALGAGLGALGGGLMGAATKGVTGAIQAGAQGATQAATDTVAQAGLELGSTTAANNAGQLGIRGIQEATTSLLPESGARMSAQLGQGATQAGLQGATQAAQGGAALAGGAGAGGAIQTGADLGLSDAGAQVLSTPEQINAAFGAPQAMLQAPAGGGGALIPGTPLNTGMITNSTIGATPQTGAALNVGETGGQLTTKNAPQPGFFERVGAAFKPENLNAAMRENAMQQLQMLPYNAAQNFVGSSLQNMGNTIYNQYAPQENAGRPYANIGGFNGAPITMPLGYGPAVSLGGGDIRDLPIKNQFMMSLGQGLSGLGQQYAADQQYKVETPERPFGLTTEDAAAIEAPYREAAEDRRKADIENARFMQQMGLQQAEFGEQVRSNQATEGIQTERLELEREGQGIERDRYELAEREFIAKEAREPSPEEAANMRAVQVKIAETEAGTAATRAETERMRAETERQLAPLRRRLLLAQTAQAEDARKQIGGMAAYDTFEEWAAANPSDIARDPIGAIAAGFLGNKLSPEQATAKYNALPEGAKRGKSFDEYLMSQMGGEGGGTPNNGSVPFATGVLDASIGTPRSNVTPSNVGDTLNQTPSASTSQADLFKKETGLSARDNPTAFADWSNKNTVAPQGPMEAPDIQYIRNRLDKLRSRSTLYNSDMEFINENWDKFTEGEKAELRSKFGIYK